MTIDETRAFLKEISKTGSILGMESMIALCEELGNPQDMGKMIHIAGTNGKGSTGAMIEQALLSMGYKVGRYTSPAVFCYEEIFMINHQAILPERLATLMTEVRDACNRMVDKGLPHPTVFEVETAAAFLFFAEEECDFTLIEVGMGGRTDATNVIKKPLVSVITSISKDHTQFLGDTIEEISYMKAGIIKDDSFVVKLKQSEAINEVIEKEVLKTKGGIKRLVWADAANYPICCMDEARMCLMDERFGEFWISMPGSFQQENFACAMETIKLLMSSEEISCSESADSIKEAFSTLKWPGRFEKIKEEPICIIDGCHNADAADKLAETIRRLLGNKRIHFVIGVLGDKDYEAIFSKVLPLGKSASCITPNNARGLAKEKLVEVAHRHLGDVAAYDSVPLAIKAALAKCVTKEDMVLVFGSLSYLGEVKRYVDELCRTINEE